MAKAQKPQSFRKRQSGESRSDYSRAKSDFDRAEFQRVAAANKAADEARRQALQPHPGKRRGSNEPDEVMPYLTQETKGKWGRRITHHG